MIFKDKGYIGYFEMEDKEQGKVQLESYVNQLASHENIVGPINGSTWGRYRLVSTSDGSPSFLLEPENPLWYNDVYLESGFVPIKQYVSERFEIKDIEPMTLRVGGMIRAFESEDLPIIYELSKTGFENNFLYDDICYDLFEQQYRPMLAMADPQYILLAFVNHQPAGFLFSYVSEGALILKSVAVLPAFKWFGLGTRLVNQALMIAEANEIKTAVAALMEEENVSRKISAKYGGKVFRTYTLYGLKK